MIRVLMVLAVLAVLVPVPGVALALVVLAAAGAVARFAVWSYRADPPVWRSPGPNWSGRFV
ncbi:hypothetical protein [Pseudofrankia inefficax]|uniref:Uncharacterized protein n=1 Tax=Pseudofrankia inefficax (strain DSM 45817 / CECT 9037 / DDB 130130 / EuI1c) TaxID=298654 RepID=E3J666_PSEI1|nr:hypothetical protein [Pseudofrankia inefficax]ADP78357.1 hypothetical protein FraEuI1c_0271 [Pseudofrankia inefficax]